MKNQILKFIIGLPVFVAIIVACYFLTINYYIFVCEVSNEFNISVNHTCLGNPTGVKVFFGTLYIAATVILASLAGLLIFTISCVLGEEVIDKTEDAILTIKQKAKSKKIDDKKGALSLIESIRGALSKKK